MKIVLLGPPGAGKGTQAVNIKTELGVPHISTGDIFRTNIKNQTDLGKKVSAYLDKGQLVPDELTIDMVWDRLDQEDCENGFILDGFPRTIGQAQALKEGLEERSTSLDSVINISVPAKVLIKRLSGRRVCSSCGAPYHVDSNPPKVEGVCDECGSEVIQRVDDNEDTVKNRIEIYEDETAPLIDFYDKQGLLKTFDGTKDIDIITADILNFIRG